ncbi:MAG: MBL fold metallo-hydrolase [Chloroflexi bacterium]|nr:MBL fold metallo-hydrolase [Chloroflexota bacterium]
MKPDLRRGGPLLLFLLLLLALAGCRQPAAPQGLQVHFIDVGQGDAILVRGPEGETVLIDGGEAEPGVLSHLRREHVIKLDALVTTHPHSDHVGGLIAVLKEIPVKEVWVDGQVHTTRTYENLLDAIDRSGAVFKEARRGGEIKAGKLTFKILHPTTPFLEGPDALNNNSVVLHLTYGQISFLLTGDAETEAEKSILAYTGDLKATVLKLGHHGSRTSTSEAFLQAVRPELAVYMAGAGNPYGHPHRQTLTRLRRLNVKVYGTDNNGTVVISSADGVNYSVSTEKGGEVAFAPQNTPSLRAKRSNPLVGWTSAGLLRRFARPVLASDAKQSPRWLDRPGDCFASLAMTS